MLPAAKRCSEGPDCSGPLWECRSCGAVFCLDHSHVTGLGANVECMRCEDTRLEAAENELLRPHPAERTLEAYDRKDKESE